jgi:hypothetical protein
MISDEKLAILERFGSRDVQDMVAEIWRLRRALTMIALCERDEGLSHMVQEMRGRAFAALNEVR